MTSAAIIPRLPGPLTDWFTIEVSAVLPCDFTKFLLSQPFIGREEGKLINPQAIESVLLGLNQALEDTDTFLGPLATPVMFSGAPRVGRETPRS